MELQDFGFCGPLLFQETGGDTYPILRNCLMAFSIGAAGAFLRALAQDTESQAAQAPPRQDVGEVSESFARCYWDLHPGMQIQEMEPTGYSHDQDYQLFKPI